MGFHYICRLCSIQNSATSGFKVLSWERIASAGHSGSHHNQYTHRDVLPTCFHLRRKQSRTHFNTSHMLTINASIIYNVCHYNLANLISVAAKFISGSTTELRSTNPCLIINTAPRSCFSSSPNSSMLSYNQINFFHLFRTYCTTQ